MTNSAQLALVAIFTFVISNTAISTGNFISKWEGGIAPILRDSPDLDRSSQIYGARFAATNFFYTNTFAFGQYEVGIDGSVLRVKTSKAKDNPNFSNSITVLSPAVVARWYPITGKVVIPFIEAGIGPSYMSNNNFEGRKLGKRFAFQDLASVGIKTTSAFRKDEFLLGLYVIHYSNAGIEKNNRGITLPVAARFGYRF